MVLYVISMSSSRHVLPKLLNFFIFNSSYGQTEGYEHEKTLYYYPKKVDRNTQVKQVGLAEALTKFSSIFSKSKDCECIHTQKTRQAFLQVEPNVWMVMTIGIGWKSWQKESVSVQEYLSEDVQDSVLHAHLCSAYQAFALRHKSLNYVIATKGLNSLKIILEEFFTMYLSCVDLRNGDIFSVWSGLSYLPLDRQTFLQVHSCLSYLQSSIPGIQHTVFFYDRHVVWSGFNLDDLQSLTQYLNNCFFKDKPKVESSSGSSVANCSSSRFASAVYFPVLHVYVKSREGSLELFQLLVYSSSLITICVTFPAESDLSSSVFERIHCTLENKVSKLSEIISEYVNRPPTGHSSSNESGGNLRFIHHNSMNLATRTTVSNPDLRISPEVMQTVIDMHDDMKSHCSDEIVAKNVQEYWIFGRCGNGHEFFMIISHRNANLAEITDEVNRLSSSYFSNIFKIDT